jgi:hypothetical protein
VPTKGALSLLFIVAVLVQPHPIPRYYHLSAMYASAYPIKRCFSWAWSRS